MIASQAELESILQSDESDRAKTWDARPCQEASVDDLVVDMFLTTYRTSAVARSVIEENHRPLEVQLAALRLYDLRAKHPTNAGVLLLGRDPQFFFPGAYFQYVRYDGTGPDATVMRERRYSGDLLTVLRGLGDLTLDLAVERPIPAADRLGDRIVATYPTRAMHELFMNAAIHRNCETTTPTMVNHFSDRIEIFSSGGLYGDLTPDQFPHGTAYRNPVIAEAAKVLGFVNRFGRGIDLAQADLAKNGSLPAKFSLGANHVLVTVWGRP